MWSTRKKEPRKGSVAATIKNGNRNRKVAIEGAANVFLNAANKANSGNASNRSKKLRNIFNKLRLESEQVISSDKINTIVDKIYEHSNKSKIDNKLSVLSISVLIQRGDIGRAIAKLLNGETPTIEKGSNLDIFFDTYNHIIQDIIIEVLKIPESHSGSQQGGGIEIAVAVSIVMLILSGFLSRLFTDYFCKFTSYKNRKWCVPGFDNEKPATSKTTDNPLRVAPRNQSLGVALRNQRLGKYGVNLMNPQ